MPRIWCPDAQTEGQTLLLPPDAARHVQVLRLQPGDALTLFGHPDRGGEFDAQVLRMGRSDVEVQVGAHHPVNRETGRQVHLAVVMPANDRMDWLVEKATEMGVASVQPLMSARSVLRLKGERADKKVAHWQAVAVAACEQCGGNRVPQIHPVLTLEAWVVKAQRGGVWTGWLSLTAGSRLLPEVLAAEPLTPVWCFVTGPEGGFEPAEEDLLARHGLHPVALGPRVLRAETAALAALGCTVWAL